MRNPFCIWACLVIILSSFNASASNIGNEETTSKKSAKSTITFIPGKSLNVQVIEDKDLLLVNLEGDTAELDWIIFQPKGEVISRISTSAKIDEIKICNLDKGDYVLMLKDKEGRVLYSSFSKA